MTRHLFPLVLALAPLASAGSGTLTIGSVSGSSPGPYTLTMTTSVSGVTVGDDLGAKLSSGAGCIYEVTATDTTLLTVTVSDTRTAGNGGTVFGPPATGSCWYATPTQSGAADDVRLAKPPTGGVGWGAALNMNTELTEQRINILERQGSGSAYVSSSASSYAQVTTYTIAASTFDTNGTAIRVTCNVAQNAGTGVKCRVGINGTGATESQIVGKFEAIIVKEGANLQVYTTGLGATSSYSRSTFTGLTFTSTISLTLEIAGGDTGTGTAVNFWLIERLR